MSQLTVRERVKKARQASLELGQASDKQRQAVLMRYAELLEERAGAIEDANAEDMRTAEHAVHDGELSQALFDRLDFQGAKREQAIEAVRAVAELEDPIGQTVRSTLLDDGLELFQVRVPIGVVACAYESRPDAGVQLISLAIRSGNALILKGGSEARNTNRVTAELARRALEDAGLPRDCVVGLEEREELAELLELDELVDLIIPRGSTEFVGHVQANTRIPVLGHTDGICHTYVDGAADLDEALEVCLDAKLDYPAACNATETFLVHEAIADTFVPQLVDALDAKGVTVHADEAARRRAPGCETATRETWQTEWNDLACGLRVVGGLDEAIDHVNTFGSGHTDAILTEDENAARRFIAGIDTAGAFWNASTRFADGFRYGLGAEVGISTGKIHARGPVGLEGLTTTKWILKGDGHTAGPYQGDQRQAFKHETTQEAWGG